MPAKHKYNFVKKSFDNEGYILLSTTYRNSSTLLDYVCPSGHKHKIRFNDWRNGVRCPECYKRTYRLKYRIEEIKQRYISEGYKLLTVNFENSESIVEIMCPEKHVFKQKIKAWQSGNRCPYCSNRVRLKDQIVEIKESLAKENYIFKGFLKRKIKYICPMGHKHAVLWTDWQRGIRCPHCSGNAKKTIEFIRESFLKEDYTLLTEQYKNCYTKLWYICPEGHKRYITWSDWNNGYRCRLCADLKNSIRFAGSGHPNWQGGVSFEPYCQDWTKEYKEFIKERDGYKCLNPDCRKVDATLSVHHIDYNKKNCKPSNLITLCRSCNSRANTDRKWHKFWYKAILYRRYGYV